MHGLTFKGEKIIFMENDITNLVQSMITGGVRGALGELAIRESMKRGLFRCLLRQERRLPDMNITRRKRMNFVRVSLTGKYDDTCEDDT